MVNIYVRKKIVSLLISDFILLNLMGRIMRFYTLLTCLAVAFGVTVSTAQASSFFDPVTNSFIEVGPNRGGPKIPRKEVSFDEKYAPGTIVVKTDEKRLYYVLERGKAMRYGIGVGRPGFQWGGVKRITRKAEWPGWTPPPHMRKRQPDLPAFMPGGPDNPLGARAMYLGSSLYRIHGTNQAWSIGQELSSGCFRMLNEDVEDLYSRVKVGTKVIVER